MEKEDNDEEYKNQLDDLINTKNKQNEDNELLKRRISEQEKTIKSIESKNRFLINKMNKDQDKIEEANMEIRRLSQYESLFKIEKEKNIKLFNQISYLESKVGQYKKHIDSDIHNYNNNSNSKLNLKLSKKKSIIEKQDQALGILKDEKKKYSQAIEELKKENRKLNSIIAEMSEALEASLKEKDEGTKHAKELQDLVYSMNKKRETMEEELLSSKANGMNNELNNNQNSKDLEIEEDSFS